MFSRDQQKVTAEIAKKIDMSQEDIIDYYAN